MSSVKLLGLNISIDLKWTCHMSESSSKVSAWLYYLKQQGKYRNQGNHKLLLNMRPSAPVIDKLVPFFTTHSQAIPLRWAWELVEARHEELLILSHACTYQEALGLASLETLFERGQVQTVKLSQNISNNPDLANYAVFFYRVQTNTVLIWQNNRRFDNSLSICKTNRLKSFFPPVFYRNCI